MYRMILRWVPIYCLSNFLLVASLFACQYNVRDLAFSKLGTTEYTLYLYIQDDTPREFVETFQSLSSNMLEGSGVRFEIVNVERQQRHPALEFIDPTDSAFFPRLVLVAPDKRTLSLELPESYNRPQENLPAVVSRIVTSPVREKILKNIGRTYCTVILLEDSNRRANERAYSEIKSACDGIERVLYQITRSIEKPPQIIRLSQDENAAEKVLLWSLGEGILEGGAPRVYVLHGRGRRIGSVLKGDGITRKSVFEILSLVGASCECGFDTGSLLGPQVPLRWSADVSSEVEKCLGFDVENPLIEAEMGRILARGVSSESGRGKAVSGNYDEIFVRLKRNMAGKLSPAQLSGMAGKETKATFFGSKLLIHLAITLGAIALAVAVGTVIVLRKRG